MDRRELLINHMRKSGYQLMEDDVFNTANNLRQYDDDLILFFNPKEERYEVHTCTFFPSKKPTYCISSKTLEDVFYRLRQADNRVIDFKKKMEMVEESKLKHEIEKEKREQDLRENFVKEVVKTETTKHF